MKNLTQYLKLWRKKRDELRVDTDAASDWLEMGALLDKHMPVDDNSNGASPQKGISLLSTVLITLAAAAMLYVGHSIIETKKKTAYHKDTLYHKKHYSSSMADSLATSDSLKQDEDQIVNGDSTSAIQNAAASTAQSDNPSNRNNGKPLVKTDSANSQNAAAQLNGDNGNNAIEKQNTATSSNPPRLTDYKKPNLADERDELKNCVQTNKQRPALSSNSSQLLANNKKLNLRDRKRTGNTQASEQSRDMSSSSSNLNKQNLLTNANRRNQFQTTESGNGQNVSAHHGDRFNTNSFYTEADLNIIDRNQHYIDGSQSLVLIPNCQHLGVSPGTISVYPALKNKSLFQANIADLSKTKKNKSRLSMDTSNIIWEWGILLGANSNGSFTSKSQNKNFYGSLPADVFTGLYANYNFNPKWGVGGQVNILSPQNENGGTYAGLFLNTVNGITTVDFKSINNSRKVYSIQVPLYALYHLTKNIGFKGGSVASFPVKQISTINPADTVNNPILVTAQYQKKTNYSLLGGINYRYKRLIFEADYLKGLTKHDIISDTLIHRGTNNTFQFSIKLQLGGKKK